LFHRRRGWSGSGGGDASTVSLSGLQRQTMKRSKKAITDPPNVPRFKQATMRAAAYFRLDGDTMVGALINTADVSHPLLSAKASITKTTKMSELNTDGRELAPYNG